MTVVGFADGTPAGAEPPAGAPAPGEPPLPQHWSTQVDKATGQNYFYNAMTGASSWTRPVGPPAAHAPLWEHAVDEKSGRAFYKNLKTGATTWAKPTGAIAPLREDFHAERQRRQSVAAAAAAAPSPMGHGRRSSMAHTPNSGRRTSMAVGGVGRRSSMSQAPGGARRMSVANGTGAAIAGMVTTSAERGAPPASLMGVEEARTLKGATLMYTAAVLRRDKEMTSRVRSVKERNLKDATASAERMREVIQTKDSTGEPSGGLSSMTADGTDGLDALPGFELPSLQHDEGGSRPNLFAGSSRGSVPRDTPSSSCMGPRSHLSRGPSCYGAVSSGLAPGLPKLRSRGSLVNVTSQGSSQGSSGFNLGLASQGNSGASLGGVRRVEPPSASALPTSAPTLVSAGSAVLQKLRRMTSSRREEPAHELLPDRLAGDSRSGSDDKDEGGTQMASHVVAAAEEREAGPFDEEEDEADEGQPAPTRSRATTQMLALSGKLVGGGDDDASPEDESEEEDALMASPEVGAVLEALEENFRRRWRVIPDEIKHAEEIARADRQRVLRRVIGSMAYDMAEIFGFQKEHWTKGPDGKDVRVLSSVANQVEHLSMLLANRMDSCEGKDFITRLYNAIAALHKKVLTNYEKWVVRLQLLPASGDSFTSIEFEGDRFLSLGNYDVTLGDFASLEEGNAWVHNAQLQRLTLYFLMWGEAANVRHLPECLCFVFYAMLHCLMLPDTRICHTSTGVDFQEVQFDRRATEGGGEEASFGAGDYLTSMIIPIYEFVFNEVAGRAKDMVMTRVMYDDITESFWQRPLVEALLPPGEPNEQARARGAYRHFRKLLADPELYAPATEEKKAEMKKMETRAKTRAGKKALALGKGSVENLLKRGRSYLEAQGGGAPPPPKPKEHPLRAFLGKTYLEKPGWLHCYHIFGRILLWHAIAFHAALVGTFFGWEWRHLNVVCMTHAAGKILRQLVDWSIGHPPRSVDSKVFMGREGSQSFTEHVTMVTLYALVPLCYLVEKSVRRFGNTTLYDMAAYAYVATFAGSYFIHTKPGYRVRSLWRKKHEQHIGSDEQLRVPLGTFVTYSFFWAVVLTLKLWFDVFLIVIPLRQPILGLLHYPFANLLWQGCPTFESKLGEVAAQAWLDHFCGWYELTLRMILVILRLSVPFLVFYFDTYIFFNVCSAAFSSLIALRRRIGVVSHWRHVVIYLQDNVRDFNAKLLGTVNGDSASAARASARSGNADWCVEARSLEWQCYARAWNSIISTLRDSDALSNAERDELLFFWLDGADSEAFFDVPEYVLFPTFVTSLVLTQNAVPLQSAARVAALSRRGGEHA